MTNSSTGGLLPSFASIGRVFVSGVSSGAYMATQLHVSYSSLFAGAGMFAGGPFGCAQGQLALALNACTDDTLPLDLPALQALTIAAEGAGTVDALSNIKGSPVWLLHGTEDVTVKASVADAAAEFYTALGAQVAYNNSMYANHAWLSPLGENACTVSQSPYTSNCPDTDMVGAMLAHLLGAKPNPPRSDWAPQGKFVQFSQELYAQAKWGMGANMISMDETGYLYVPPQCEAMPAKGANATTCDLFVVLHGCEQCYSIVGRALLDQSFMTQYADANNLLLLFPQTIALSLGLAYNPEACWDWWGYLGGDAMYTVKGGYQIEVLVSMVRSLSPSLAHRGLPAEKEAANTAAEHAAKGEMKQTAHGAASKRGAKRVPVRGKDNAPASQKKQQPASSSSLQRLCSLDAPSRASTFLAAVQAGSAKRALVPDATRTAQALEVFRAFREHFVLSNTSATATQLVAAFPSDGVTASPYWNLAAAISSLADAVASFRSAGSDPALASAASDALSLAEALVSTQAGPVGGGFMRDWFDDESWMVQAMLDLHDLTGKQEYVDQARALFADILIHGFDADTGLVWWDRAHTQRATAANAGAIVCALRLAALASVPSSAGIGVNAPSFAAQLYQRWRAYTRDSGEVLDHLDPQGNEIYYDPGFTYNEALMVQSALGLLDQARAAGNTTEMQQLWADALLMASYTATNLSVASPLSSTAGGNVMADCINSPCSGDCVQFKGIAFRALGQLVDALGAELLLEAQSGSATPASIETMLDSLCQAEKLLDSSAASAWTVARSTSTGAGSGPEQVAGLFNCQWQEEWPAQGMAVLQGAQNAALTAFARQAGQEYIWIAQH